VRIAIDWLWAGEQSGGQRPLSPQSGRRGRPHSGSRRAGL